MKNHIIEKYKRNFWSMLSYSIGVVLHFNVLKLSDAETETVVRESYVSNSSDPWS
jgi:hypothetical protein